MCLYVFILFQALAIPHTPNSHTGLLRNLATYRCFGDTALLRFHCKEGTLSFSTTPSVEIMAGRWDKKKHLKNLGKSFFFFLIYFGFV